MITHYDIKMEIQKLKEVLSVEGVNLPSLLQVIKPGIYVFLCVFMGFIMANFSAFSIG